MRDKASTGDAFMLGTNETLDAASQQRNIFVYSAVLALMYLSAPIIYVGFVQAALCKRLHTSDTIANLPNTLYLAMAWCPVVTAWLFPKARQLKPVLGLGFAAMAVASAAVAGLLLLPVSNTVIIGAVLVHATLLGAANGVVFMLSWEALSRGVAEGQRGRALGLAYGWGPGFAVLGSLWGQMLMDGKVLGWKAPAWMAASYPYSYALLFAATALTMGVAALLVPLYRLPMPTAEPERQGFREAVLGGFKTIARHRVLLIACIAYLLVCGANTIQTNMSIFTHEVVGRSSEDLAGYQLSLRFSFKMLAGFLLGWLLTRTHAKVPLLVTVGLQIIAVLWVMLVPGYWFLLAFGLNGAAELSGVYYMNYPVAASVKSEVRGNLAFLMLASSAIGLAPVCFGWISDHWGLRASFVAALVLLGFIAALVGLKLPAQPKPFAEN
ncbi:MAG: hypothetical protein JWM32_2545 [Verrucomicrobia bacterium]|nr:hypothetical protein [Verrucomicrobiota bacterium]